MRGCSRLTSEQGSSLIIVIMMLMVVSGLVAAMVASSMTDTLVARNHHSGAQAQAAAEAGLNHAIDASRAYLRNWESNFTNTNDAVSRLLCGPDNDATTTADNGSLAPDLTAPSWLVNGTPTPPALLALASLDGVRYSARIYDDDDPALQNAWTAADLTRLGEGSPVGAPIADPTVDRNGVFVVRATGYARDNTAVTLEALMKPLPWPAIVANGDLSLAGSPQILGDGGSIHANGGITEVGNGATVQNDVTAVGTITTNPNWAPVTGLVEGGQLPITIPSVNVSDYMNLAQFRLAADGSIWKIVGGVQTQLCSNNSTCGNVGFAWSSKTSPTISNMPGIGGVWTMNGDPNCTKLDTAGVPNCGAGVYYAEASDVKLTGNIGSAAAPYHMSLLVDGSLTMGGSPILVPAISKPNILIVCNGDVDLEGTANCTINGQVRIREQFKMLGNMILTGQVLIENRWDISTSVQGASTISGSATVHNDRLAVYDFAVAGWREFRR